MKYEGSLYGIDLFSDGSIKDESIIILPKEVCEFITEQQKHINEMHDEINRCIFNELDEQREKG